MEEWKEYKLGDVLSIRYGKDHKALKDGPTPVYGSGGIMRYASDYLYDKPSILIPRKGSLNNIFYVEEPFWTVDTMFWTIVNESIVLPKYLYYTLCKFDFASMDVGSAIPSLTVPIIEGIEISLPSLQTQRRIAAVLSSLDAKIELNRRINDNLEQQAQTLFRSWFVDFEPFGGEMPKEWKVGQLEEIGEIVGGGTPSKTEDKYYCENGISWITPKDLSVSKSKFVSRGEFDITDEGYTNSSAKKMPAGSVLFSSRAPIGYIAIALNEVTTNQGFKSVVPIKAGTCFIYLYLKEQTPRIEAQATGSTFKEASNTLMKAQEVVIPPSCTLNDFESLVCPLFRKQEALEAENTRLSTLRDTLLPKLMSGELKINEINA